MEFNKEFDASGLSCPLPIVKTKKALTDMVSGQVLRVISTDPGSWPHLLSKLATPCWNKAAKTANLSSI